MYNSNELPKRRKIEPDEFADLLCSGEMVMIREPDIEKHPKHRIYRYSPKDIFVYQPKVNKQRTCISYATCLLMCRDSRTVKIETKKLFFSRKFQVQHRRILTYAKKNIYRTTTACLNDNRTRSGYRTLGTDCIFCTKFTCMKKLKLLCFRKSQVQRRLHGHLMHVHLTRKKILFLCIS